MPTSPVKKHRSPAEWKAIIERQEQSGLSQRAFCQKEGISLSSFARHRQERPDPRSAFIELPTKSENAPSKSETPPAVQDKPWSVEVALPNGCLLRFRG